MGPAMEPEMRQDVSQDIQESGLFLVHGDKPIQATPIPATGLNDIQAFEFLDDASRRHLQPALVRLTFQQAVSGQGQHVDEQHPFNPFVLVQIDG
jgi:hypothetical protein